jgi:aryl-alcohol dehydrogenase-like predicted oxidoreductase
VRKESEKAWGVQDRFVLLSPRRQADAHRGDSGCDGRIKEVCHSRSSSALCIDASYREGKIGAIGLSEVSAATIRRAEKVHHIDAVQLEYSPFALDIESEEIGILKTCRELGVAVVAYSPLGRGFLTGQIKSRTDFDDGDFRKYAPRYSEENFGKNLKLVEKLQELATAKGCTSGQLSLSWLLAQSEDIIPIP